MEKFFKYSNAFFGAIFGTVTGLLMLIVSLPILLAGVSIRDGLIPEIRKKPLRLLNPLILIGLVLLVGCILLLSVFSSIFLGISIGKNTAIASYNHGWRAWVVPFKLVNLSFSDRYDDANVKNITGLNQDEKYKRAEAAISTQAIKTNNMVKQTIDHNLAKRTTEGNKTIPIEITAIMTTYSMEEYKKDYDNGEIRIERQYVANIAEKNLNQYIHQAHAISWSARFFSFFRPGRYTSHSERSAAYPLNPTKGGF